MVLADKAYDADKIIEYVTVKSAHELRINSKGVKPFRALRRLAKL